MSINLAPLKTKLPRFEEPKAEMQEAALNYSSRLIEINAKCLYFLCSFKSNKLDVWSLKQAWYTYQKSRSSSRFIKLMFALKRESATERGTRILFSLFMSKRKKYWNNYYLNENPIDPRHFLFFFILIVFFILLITYFTYLVWFTLFISVAKAVCVIGPWHGVFIKLNKAWS